MEALRVASLALLLTSFVAVEARALRVAVLAYMGQALLMVAVIAGFAGLHPDLWTWAATALVTKFGIVSWLLHRAARGHPREVEPYVGAAVSTVLLAVLAVAVYRLVHAHAGFLAPTPLAAAEPYRTNVAVSLTLFGMGLYAVLTRRDALKVVIGVCLTENGAHLSLVSLAPGMHETVLIGITTDVVLAVFLLLVLVRGIEARFGSRDTSRLRALRW